MHYSPKPLEAYKLDGVNYDHTNLLATLDYGDAAWNLMWLSDPRIDKVPGAGGKWSEHYTAKDGALSALISDVRDDIVLCSKLRMPPSKFLEWFRREDASVFDCYPIYGREVWVETVKARAAEAMRRLEPRTQGNVITVNFRRSA